MNDLLKLLTNPIVTAAAGGLTSYYMWGKDEKGNKKYLYTGGGVVAGYIAGKMLQSYLNQSQQPQVAPQPQAQPVQGLPAHDDTVDLDVDQTFGQAPPQTHEEAMEDAVSDQMSGLGSLDNSTLGSGGLGSFEQSLADDAAIQETLEEVHRKGRGYN